MMLTVTNVTATGNEKSMITLSFLPTDEVLNTTSIPGWLESLLFPIYENPLLDYIYLCELLNWVVVSDFWIRLYDAGQIAPTLYQPTPRRTFNFTNPMALGSTNNIFVNNTLFQSYTNFLIEKFNIKAGFLPLTSTNRLFPVDTRIYRSYACSVRIKGWSSLLISVFAADYALIGSAYSLLIFVAGKIQEHKDSRESVLKRNWYLS